MEDIVQRVFAVIFAVIVFFIMPIYMTYEKKDDVSYALALRITSNFVNQVRSKGYLTQEMYDDYLIDLTATDNIYDVKMQHKHKVYSPVINVYQKIKVEERDTKKLVDTLDYSRYCNGGSGGKFNDGVPGSRVINARYYNDETKKIETKTYKEVDGYEFEITYKLGTLIYNESNILDYLAEQEKLLGDSKEEINFFSMSLKEYNNKHLSNIPKIPVTYVTQDKTAIYKMSVGDEFTVAIRNTNITLASILFDALTFSGITTQIPRVYINYGAIIKNTEYSELADEFSAYDNGAIIKDDQIKELFRKYGSSPSVRIYVNGVLTKNSDGTGFNGPYVCETNRGYTTYIYLKNP